jgi:excinuclease UvrABC ATPase subunit
MEDQQDNVKAQEKEIVDELEHEVEDLENEFSQVEDENVSESVKQKQRQVENILSEVHDQLDFLREVSDKMPDKSSEQHQKE